jgi:hypothetical protein
MAFQKRFSEGGTVQEIAAEMKIPKTTAYRWAVAVRLVAAEWFRREGFGEARLVLEWIKQAKRSRGHVLNGVLREIGSILDAYPAKKEPLPPQGPVIVLFNTKIENYKEQAYASGKVIESRSVQDESQGDAGSRPSQSSSSRRSLRDSAESDART